MKTHTLTFDRVPTNEALRLAVANLGVHCYRFISQSPDKSTYTIEEVDLAADLALRSITPDRDTWTVPVKVTCSYCGEVYQGWEVLPKKWYDNRLYRFETRYCPLCPPVSIDAWLSKVGIHQVRPESATVERVVRKPVLTTMTVEADEFE